MTLTKPKTPGAAADLLYAMRENRIKAQRYVAELKSEEEELKGYLLEALEKADSTGIAGKLARVSLVRKEIPTVSDWDKTYAYIKETGDFALLQRRINGPHVKELAADGLVVPGVSTYHKDTLSITKATRS